MRQGDMCGSAASRSRRRGGRASCSAGSIACRPARTQQRHERARSSTRRRG
jgi:hypothetical protein